MACRHYAISLKYLYVMQTSQKLKITTPDSENQADFGDKICKPKPIDEKKWPFLAFSGCIRPVSLNF